MPIRKTRAHKYGSAHQNLIVMKPYLLTTLDRVCAMLSTLFHRANLYMVFHSSYSKMAHHYNVFISQARSTSIQVQEYRS